MWVYDEDVGLNYRDVTFVPGLYKIFDEILGKLRDLTVQWLAIYSENKFWMPAY